MGKVGDARLSYLWSSVSPGQARKFGDEELVAVAIGNSEGPSGSCGSPATSSIFSRFG